MGRLSFDRHLLILDLDETLIYGTEEPLERTADFRVERFHLYRRPHLAEFLSTVSTWYELAVWSSASRPYVEGVVRSVFPDPAALRFVWSSGRCTQRWDHEWQRHHWVKDLKKAKRAGYPLERILVLDDSPEKLERNYGNLLRVQPFMGEEADVELRDLLPFLDRLRSVENMRKVEKRGWRNSVR